MKSFLMIVKRDSLFLELIPADLEVEQLVLLLLIQLHLMNIAVLKTVSIGNPSFQANSFIRL
jgi:hypothetical protein